MTALPISRIGKASHCLESFGLLEVRRDTAEPGDSTIPPSGAWVFRLIAHRLPIAHRAEFDILKCM